jgi:putative transposase
MYSYEARVRAVRLYIKLGKRVAATIRQLGYPTKNSLKSWHREYEERLGLPTGYVRLPKYSQAQKELAVEHYVEHGRCISASIRALVLLCHKSSFALALPQQGHCPRRAISV